MKDFKDNFGWKVRGHGPRGPSRSYAYALCHTLSRWNFERKHFEFKWVYTAWQQIISNNIIVYTERPHNRSKTSEDVYLTWPWQLWQLDTQFKVLDKSDCRLVSIKYTFYGASGVQHIYVAVILNGWCHFMLSLPCCRLSLFVIYDGNMPPLLRCKRYHSENTMIVPLSDALLHFGAACRVETIGLQASVELQHPIHPINGIGMGSERDPTHSILIPAPASCARSGAQNSALRKYHLTPAALHAACVAATGQWDRVARRYRQPAGGPAVQPSVSTALLPVRTAHVPPSPAPAHSGRRQQGQSTDWGRPPVTKTATTGLPTDAARPGGPGGGVIRWEGNQLQTGPANAKEEHASVSEKRLADEGSSVARYLTITVG